MFMFRGYRRFLCGAIFSVLITFAIALTCSESAFADQDSTSISISAEPLIEWDIETGFLETTSYSIQVSADGLYGYSITLSTIGESTNLTNKSDDSYYVPTITLPNQASTIPSSQIENAYGYSLDGVNYKPVPTAGGQGDLIADVDVLSADISQTHTIDFGIKVDDSIPTGIYGNVLLFTVVASEPITCDANTICYIENGAVVGEHLEDQPVIYADTMLTAPNFYRKGYGFAGWNTRADGHGTDYGPNEAVATNNLSTSGLILFAKWIPSSGEMQSFTGCDAMKNGDVIALTDNRDNNTYVVTKMSDGGCWMTENLRLDLSDPDLNITTANTNNPSEAFMDGMRNNNPASTTAFCNQVNENCLNRIRFNTDNINLESDNYNIASGVYYNWYTATAGNGGFRSIDGQPVAGDICPVNWRLPHSNGNSSDLVDLDIALGGDGVVHSNNADSKRWRKYPINFILGGQVKDSAVPDVGVSGNYYAAEGMAYERATNLWLLKDKAVFDSTAAKHRGQSVRCMMKKTYKVKYDKNAPEGATIDGEMGDQYIARGISKKLIKNNFTHTYSNHVFYQFKEWNTKRDGSGDSYSDEAEVLDIAAANGEITLYAQWNETRYTDLTVVFDENAISSFTAQNSEFGNVTTSTNGGTVEVALDKPYTISFDLDVDYEFVRYETTNNGVLGSTTSSPTDYTVSSDGVTLTIIAKEREHPLYIQNLDSSVCSATPKLVTDIRDGQQYLVERLADGKCWMIDDLRLGSTELENPISSENTNISSETSFTLPASSDALTTRTNIPQMSANIVGQTINSFGDTTGQAGMYYNYCTTTAGTVCSHNDIRNATQDICPAGWRLPTGGAGGEQETLFNQFGSVAGMQTGASLTYAGWYSTDSGGTLKEFETASWTWSSTGKSNNKAHVMFIGRTKKSFADGHFEYYAHNIRCVMK